MKDIMIGIKKAKSRTIISAIIIFIMSAVICISASLISPGGMPNTKDFPQNSQSQQNSTDSNNETTENQTTSGETVSLNLISTSNETTENATTQSSEDTTTESSENSTTEKIKPDNMPSNNRTWVVIIPIAALLIGVALLILVNSNNTKKRIAQFQEMMQRGITPKQIKKQLVKEVVCVAVVFAIIGSGVGIAASAPISKLMMSSQVQNIPNMTDDDNSEDSNRPEMPNGGDFNGEMPEMPSGEMPEMPSGEMPEMPSGGQMPSPGERPDAATNSEDSNSSNSSEDTNTDNKGVKKSSGFRYIISGVLALASIIVFATASALGVALPIKKQEK